MTDFAPPLSKLGESGIGFAAAPTGGMGFALDGNGKLPANIYPSGAGGPPGTELTYDQITANVTVAATTEAGATTVITATAFTYDGTTTALFEFFAGRVVTSANAGDDITIYLFEDGVIAGIMGQLLTPAAGALGVPVLCSLRKTPAAGTHTYSIRAKRTTANGTVLAGSGGTGAFFPSYLRVSKV